MPNRLGEQIGAVPVPQIKEEVSERTQHAHFGREAFEKGYFDCEDPKDLVMHPPLTPIDQPGDQACRDPADSIHRRDWRHACGDATTGPSDSDCAEDGVCPVDQPGDQACREAADSKRRQGCRRACGDATTVPQIQTWKTVEAPPSQFIGMVVDAPVIMQMRQCRPEMSPLRLHDQA